MNNKELWERDLFLNDNIIYLFNNTIYEYDMKEAGFSLIQLYKLLDDDTIRDLNKLDKKARSRKIGKLQISNKDLKDGMKQAFIDARELFINSNMLDVNDIISIKKDALFIKKRCKNTKFLDYIDFRIKNTYSSYIRLDKLEMYYNPERLDIKGINDNVLQLHYDGILQFIYRVFRTAETSSVVDVIRYIVSFIDKYKRKELPLDYYREFNARSMYTTMIDDTYYETYIDDIEDLNIKYNYDTIIIPILQIFIK